MSAALPFIDVVVAKLEKQTEQITLFHLRAADDVPLPAFEAGAHIMVELPGGHTRAYSLCGNPADASRYEIAVKREDGGQGGSLAAHTGLRLHERMRIGAPRNLFPLAPAAPHHLLLGGGIGLTPLLAMADALHSAGASFELALFARDATQMPMTQRLANAPWAARATLYFDDVLAGQGRAAPEQLQQIIATQAPAAHVYFCGPPGFMATAKDACTSWEPARIHYEYFTAPPSVETPDAGLSAYEVVLKQSGTRIAITTGVSLIEALHAAGADIATVCEQGICGSCVTPYLSGTPIHRDTCLTDEERLSYLAVCCAGSASAELVLDY
ncbi:MAG: hypothetical protein JWQ10_4121 [Herbaspirillum sp.]|nr:hypothetical protein [Herbaspirillum sp.]